MRVMSWNVNKSANSAGRIDRQLDFIEDCDPDVLLLQEVRYGTDQKWMTTWEEGLAALGLGELVHSCDVAAELRNSTVPPHDDIGHDNGHITATRDGWSLTHRERPLSDPVDSDDEEQIHFPEKILVADAETSIGSLELWNVRAVPGRSWGVEKVKIFEEVYERLTDAGPADRILAGDFNSPKAELPDGQAVPFGYDKSPALRHRQVNAELNLLKGLGHLGLLDLFRTHHGYGDIEAEDTSWKDKRFDHVFASETLKLKRCYYDTAGMECSDHAPIIAEFDA